MTDYEKVKKELGLHNDEIDSHETDLYIKYAPDRWDYFQQYTQNLSFFQSGLGKELWFEVPFFLLDDKIRRRTHDK